MMITHKRRDYGYCMPIGQPWDYLVDEMTELKREMNIPRVSLTIDGELYWLR